LGQDSFLDVMTNALGVMVLVAVATVLQAGGAKVYLGTPVVHDPPHGAKRVLYECRDQHVVRVDEDMLDRILENELLLGFPDGRSSLGESNRYLEENDVGTEHHRIRLVRGGKEVRQRDGPQGESIAEVMKPGSSFRKSVQSLDPRRRFAFFVVHSDSFDAFQVARRIARKRGLEVGWEPHETGAPIKFGQRGRRGDRVQ